MKLCFFILSIIIFEYNSLTSTDYINSKKCIGVVPSDKLDCNNVGSDYFNGKEIACCFVTYNSEYEGSAKKCVPIYKSINGLHMYEEQIKNTGGSSISMDCSSKRIIISILMISILILLF